MTVVSVTNTLEMNGGEIKSMNLLLRLEERKNLQIKAANFVSCVFKYKIARRKNLITPKLSHDFKIKFKQYKNEFADCLRYFLL